MRDLRISPTADTGEVEVDRMNADEDIESSEQGEILLALIWLLGGHPGEIRVRARADAASTEVGAEGVRRYVLSAVRDHGAGCPFEGWNAHPPGTIDLRVFDQDVWWVDVLCRPHRISEMSTTHIGAVVTSLRRDPIYFWSGYHRATKQRERGADACVWLESTATMRTLHAEIASRGNPSSDLG